MTITDNKQSNIYPLSYNQKSILFLDQLTTDKSKLNQSIAVKILSPINMDHLKQAFQNIIDRHPIFRTIYLKNNYQNFQKVTEDVKVNFEQFNRADLNELELREKVKNIINVPFNLEKEAPFRVSLLTLADHSHILVITSHYIACNRQSLVLLLEEFKVIYGQITDNSTEILLDISHPDYTDFVQGQNDYLNTEKATNSWHYWQNKLQGEISLLNLPFDYPFALTSNNNQEFFTVIYYSELFNEIKQLSQKLLPEIKIEQSLSLILFATLQIFLYRYTAQEEILIGSFVNLNNKEKFSQTIGNFLNQIIIKGNISGNSNFKDVLKAVIQEVKETLENQDYPFELLVEKLLKQRDLSRPPFVQVLLDFPLREVNNEVKSLFIPNITNKQVNLGNLTLENYDIDQNSLQNWDLYLQVFNTDESLIINWYYNWDLFKSETIQRMIANFQVLLEGILAEPDQLISHLPLLTETEKEQVLINWNNTKVDYPDHKCIQQIFEEQVKQNPEQIADIFEDQTLTYQQLNEKANQLAHYLRKLGVKPEVLVGVCVERSPEMIIGLLGILKAGGAYVPLDPTYPQERLDYMISNAQLSILISQNHLKIKLEHTQTQIISIDTEWSIINQENTENLSQLATAENLVYVIYTSGSTGKPKGVAIQHRGLCNLAQAQSDLFRVTSSSCVLQFASFSFDASISEIVMTLAKGAKLCLGTQETLQPGMSLINILQKNKVTHVTFPPSALAVLPDVNLPDLECIIVAGEPCPSHLVEKWGKGRNFFNGYGPTEATVCATVYQYDGKNTAMPIGKPISNYQIYILDPNLQPVPIGVSGEIHIGTVGLARGYLHRPELTQEKFIANPFSNEEGSKLYKTGDLGFYLPDGNIQFLGRIDHQVKIRGFRIEVGEIESILAQHPQIKEVIVIPREDTPGDKRLVAYYVTSDHQEILTHELREYLGKNLPNYMIPAVFISLQNIPLTPNGKVDRKALPAPDPHRPQLESVYVAPKGELESILAKIWTQLLNIDQVGIYDNFFDLGGNSLLVLRVVSQLKDQLNIDVGITKIFQYPTINDLAQYLSQQGNSASIFYQKIQTRQECKKQVSEDIAIIGMAGRFPGANNINQLWENLCNGVASTTFFKDHELDPRIKTELKNDPNYVKAKGLIENSEYFDASFFGISPLEAQIMDPQQRIFLEVCYESLENAGYNSEQYNGLIGIYGGSGNNTYLLTNLSKNPDLIDRFGEFQTVVANDKDFLTTRVSYKLNLQGPSVSINTACSTSLVAIVEAVKSLRNYECDIALAGGITITTPLNSGYLYQEGAILSPDGYCRPFDEKAQGTMFNNGVAIVVLKRLEDALKDGDRIDAVIKGVGLNNDGGNKVSFTAPSVDGQSQAIMSAHADAKINPETITYIETHGTATPLGDPIEIDALNQAFNTTKKGFCAIGSVKSNLGHIISAAGVTGLIKTALALKHQKIPPTLHFHKPNPKIDFTNSPFYVNNKLIDWQSENSPRRAGVSSFGVGGTNAHIILEEAPPLPPSSPSRPQQLLLISAKTASALDNITKNLAEYLKNNSEFNLADVAYTLQVGRQALPHRRFIVCQDTEDAIVNLTKLPPNKTATRQSKNKTRELIFMFPGQGSQYVNMGKNLYDSEPLFKEVVDHCAEILKPYLGEDLRHFLYPQSEDVEKAELSLKETRITQPAIFTLEYALAKLWISWGIIPNGAIGHSIGEFVVACLAGVFSLEDALKLVAIRGKLMQDLPKGSMLSVRSNALEVEKWLNTQLETGKREQCGVATINSPSLCVVSGPTEIILEFQKNLEYKGVVCKFLHTSHAFHSPMMDPVLEPFGEIVKTIDLSPPQFPFVSTVTAEWITDKQATDPQYWTNHLRATVRFADGIKTLWEKPDRVLLEVGPRNTTATLARQQAQSSQDQIAISSLGSTSDDQGEWIALLQAIGQLYLTGIIINWQKFYTIEKRHRVPLPTYPFEGKRFWVEPVTSDQLPVNSYQSTVNSEQLRVISNPSSLENSSLNVTMSEPRQQRIIPIIKEVLETTSGFDVSSLDPETTFLEIGLDSLALTQVALDLKSKFKIDVTFRQLMETYPNLETLSEFFDQNLPPDAFPAPVTEVPVNIPTPVTEIPQATSIPQAYLTPALPTPYHLAPTTSENMNANQALVAQQLQIMARQLEILGGGVVSAPIMPPVLPAPPAPPVPSTPSATPTATTESAPFDFQKSRGPGAKIKRKVDVILTDEQQAFINQVIERYTSRTPESKRQTQMHRAYLADPRTVSGFNPLFKEMVYPIVVERSLGSKLWDVDGNEYIDITNGFGVNFFGWSDPDIVQAIETQLKKGFEIAPQCPLAGKVAKLITEFTGLERVSFCNTGSEAVTAAMRLSRTVTGRKKIATFMNDYHGIFDEVVYRQGPNYKAFSASAGILPSMFENLIVLDYGDPASLEFIRNNADDLAAVLIESVQSRHPELRPKEFLHEIRQITEKSGTAMIMDEVITGFRVHPGGAQAYYGIKADLASYGKVVGGTMPLGIIAGKAKFMDALDGGFWQYGDNSVPEAGVTFFAGTFVRQPLALAAAEAALTKLKKGGPQLQQSLADKMTKFATDLNQHFEQTGASIKLEHFSSFFFINYPRDVSYSVLLFYLLREKGLHIQEDRPCFFNLSHSEKDIEKIIWIFKDSVAEMQIAGLLPNTIGIETIKRNRSPQFEARLGKDQEGNPAWFIPDPDRLGKYLQLS